MSSSLAACAGAAAGVAVTVAAMRKCMSFAPHPHPLWKPGMGAVTSPYAKEPMVHLDPKALPLDKNYYALMISAVVPRPIAFVSTQSADGSFNLAPFSYFGAMSHDPPIVVFSCCPRGGKPKDTLANAKASGECVVNIISEHFIEAANHCCGEYPPDVDEFELSGLTRQASSLPKATPSVKEAAVSLECTVVETKDFVSRAGSVGATMVFCEVQRINVHPSVLRHTDNGTPFVDTAALQPIARLGGNNYGRIAGIFAMERPSAALKDDRAAWIK